MILSFWVSPVYAGNVHKKIRVGVYENPPKVYTDDNNRVVGIFPDILEEIARNENWVLLWTPCTWNECLEKLEGGELDLMVDVAFSEERNRKFDFTGENVFINWGKVYTRKGIDVDSLFDLRNKTIAVMKGSIHTVGDQGIRSLLSEFDIPCSYVEVDDYKSVFELLQRGAADAGIVNRLFGAVMESRYLVKGTNVIFNPRHLRFALPGGSRKNLYYIRRIDSHIRKMKKDQSSIYYRIMDIYLSGHPGHGIRLSDEKERKKMRLSERERKWIEEHPAVKIGIDPEFSPFEFRSEDGIYRGAAADYVRLISSRLGISLVPVTAPDWSRTIEWAKKRKIDALSCVGITGERKKFFEYSRPYLAFPRVIITRRESATRSLDDLGRKNVAVQINSSHHGFIKENTKIKPVLFGTFREAMIALSRGEMDAVIGNMAVSTRLIQDLALTNLKVAGYASDELFPLAFAVRKDWPVFVKLINRALDSLTEQEHASIRKRWLMADIQLPSYVDFYYRKLSQRERIWLRRHSEINLGVNENFAPYSFINGNGEYQGIAMDFVRQLGIITGIRMKRVPGLSRSEMPDDKGKGKIDLFAAADKTTERNKSLDFTGIYIPTPLVIMTRTGGRRISIPADLDGNRVALVRRDPLSDRVVSEHPGVKKYMVDTPLDGLRSVSTGESDAFVGVLGVNVYLSNKYGITNLNVAGNYDMRTRGLRFAVRKEWPELVSILEKALDSIPENRKIEIFRKWLPGVTGPAGINGSRLRVSLSDSEWSWLETHPSIRTASDSGWAPVEFIDKKGNPGGITAEYTKILEKMLGIRFEPARDLNWQEIMNRARKKEIDLVTSVVKTPQRSDSLRFTQPYISMPVVIFTRNDINYIGSMNELEGRKVAVVKKYAVEEWITDDFPKIKLVLTGTIEEAFEKLEKGEVHACIGSILVGSYYLGKLQFGTIKVSGETPYTYKLSMGVRSDWPLFAGILQKALDAIPETRQNEIYKKWISVKYEHGFDYSLFWKILIPSIIVLSLVIYWNRRLSREIEQRVKADKELVKARDAAETANRAKSAFLATMSHELRTPLNSIMGFNSILLMEMAGPLNFEQKKQLKIVKGSSQHLLNLINDVLDISKIEAGEFKLINETFDVQKLINEVIEILKPQAEKKGLEINAYVDGDIGIINGDRRRLSQVLINLLNNAVKFTGRGEITLSGRKNGSRLEIVVKDTGIGISEESIPELFLPFHQLDAGTNRVYEGTGLGLSICRRIIEMMGGEIWVESQPGRGSTFSFAVPIVREDVNEKE